jgi:[phosphatase 2A protein]-leucine-carboxy methyltransferase
MLDEIEELDLVLEHYAITWGIKLNDMEAQASWTDWGFKQA